MTTLSISSVKQAFWNVITGNSLVLAALGNGASSILLKKALRAPLPAAPFIAVAYGPTPGALEDVRTFFPTLWLYDEDPYGWTRLNALSTIIEGVLTTDCIPYCYTGYAGLGDEVIDGALSRPALSMRYQIKGRF